MTSPPLGRCYFFSTLYHEGRSGLVYFDPPLFHCYSERLLLSQWSAAVMSPAAVFFDRRHPRFRNVNSIIPIDVIRAKSYVDGFLYPACVPVRILINKLYLVSNRIVAGVVNVFRNGRGMGTGESYIPVVLFHPLHYRSPCFTDVDFAPFAGNPVDNAILFCRIDYVLWLYQPKCCVELEDGVNALLFKAATEWFWRFLINLELIFFNPTLKLCFLPSH